MFYNHLKRYHKLLIMNKKILKDKSDEGIEDITLHVYRFILRRLIWPPFERISARKR